MFGAGQPGLWVLGRIPGWPGGAGVRLTWRMPALHWQGEAPRGGARIAAVMVNERGRYRVTLRRGQCPWFVASASTRLSVASYQPSILARTMPVLSSPKTGRACV